MMTSNFKKIFKFDKNFESMKINNDYYTLKDISSSKKLFILVTSSTILVSIYLTSYIINYNFTQKIYLKYYLWVNYKNKKDLNELISHLNILETKCKIKQVTSLDYLLYYIENNRALINDNNKDIIIQLFFNYCIRDLTNIIVGIKMIDSLIESLYFNKIKINFVNDSLDVNNYYLLRNILNDHNELIKILANDFPKEYQSFALLEKHLNKKNLEPLFKINYLNNYSKLF